MKLPTILLTACAVAALSFASSSARADYEEREIDRDKPAIGVILSERQGRVTVAHVIKDSPAAEAGLERGDQIRSVDGERVRSAKQVFEQLREKDEGEEVELEVRRDDDTETLNVQLTRLGDVIQAAQDDDRLRQAAHFAFTQQRIQQLERQVQRLQRQLSQLQQQDRQRLARQPDTQRDRQFDRDQGRFTDRDRQERWTDRDRFDRGRDQRFERRAYRDDYDERR